MNSASTLMAVKVLSIIAFGAAFYWWQMRDLSQEKKRAAESQAALNDQTP